MATFDIELERKEVERAIHNSIGWAKNKDIDLLYSIIENGPDYLEVDPGEKIIKGFQDFKQNEAFWMSPDFKALRHEIRDLRIRFSKSGDFAWFFGILDDINEWKGKPTCWENTRWTGVLEKRDSKWAIVQMHFSFAAR
jgi:ketosteroid isomerase-like protein